MPVYSLNVRVFWLLVALLLSAVWLLLAARQEGGCAEKSPGAVSVLPRLLLVVSGCLLALTCCCGSSWRCQPVQRSPSTHHQQHHNQRMRRALLDSFYEHHIRLSPHVLGHSKAHVSQIVGELIRVGRAKQHDAGVIFRGDFVQIGSAYEQHKINSPDCFDILVPLKMPQSLKFDPAFAITGTSLPPELHGTMICGVAAPKKSEWVKTYKQFSDCFCTEVGPRHVMSSSSILKWFHWKIQRCLNVIRFQFEERSFITLSVCDDKLILKILPRSDYVCCHISMSVRLIPAFHVGDSVFLTAQPWGSVPQQDGTTVDSHWGVNFSKYEQKLLNWFKDQAPANSCHLKCLQIMKSLRDLSSNSFQPSFSSSWRSILSSYNLKTALFYLLLQIPFEKWDDTLLMDRMADYFTFLKECLQKETLMHFFLGNPNLPNFITVPKMFKEAVPVNLLEGYGFSLLDQTCFQLLNQWVQMPRILRMSSSPKSLMRESARCKHTTLKGGF